MKINFFIELMIFISLVHLTITSEVNSNNSFECADNFDIVENVILRSHSATDQNEAVNKLKEIILGTVNLRTFSFNKFNCILVTDDLVKVLKLDDNMNIIEQFETEEINHLGITAVGMFSDKDLVAFGNRENDVLLFNISKKRFKLIDSQLGDGKLATFITFSPDGSKFVVLNYEDDLLSIFSFNDYVLSKSAVIQLDKDSGPLIGKFSENGDKVGIFCEKNNKIKVYSYIENNWKLTDSIDMANNPFRYFFNGDELILDDGKLKTSNESKINPSDNTQNNTAIEPNSNQFSTLNTDNKTQSLNPDQPTLPEIINVEEINKIDSKIEPKNFNLTLTGKNKVLTRTSRPLIKGRTIPNQKVEIYINNHLLQEVTSDKYGNFSFRVKNSLRNGSYKVNAKIKTGTADIGSNSVDFRINKHNPLKAGSKYKKV